MYSKVSANYSNKDKGHGNLIGFGILKKSTNNGDSNSINSSQTRENNEETQQGKELDAILKRLDSLETDNTSLKADVDKLKNRLVGIESLIARNNINIDLLVNRDSLKTILLLFSINKGILTTKHLYKDLLGEYSCKENFSSLVVKSLRYLHSKLIHSGFYRKGMISLRSDNPEEIKKDLIFVESIHFIVCTIDNIIHPPSKNTPKTFSKIIGRRALDTLSQGLKLFFTNPKTIPELNQIMPKESKSEAENELEFDNYDEAKADIQNSLNIIGDNTSFCYPFYQYDDEAIQAIKDLGFKVAFAGGNKKATRSSNKSLIPRYPIYSNHTAGDIARMVN